MRQLRTTAVGLIVLAGVLLAPAHGVSQERTSRVHAYLATTEPVPGVPFELVVTAKWPAALTGEVAGPAGQLTGITVVDREVQVSEEGGIRLHRQRLRLQVPARGLYVIPPVVLDVQNERGQRVGRAKSNALYLEIPKGEGASAEMLRPIKPLVEVPYQYPSPWWLLGIAGLLAIGGLLWLYRRQQPESPAVDPYVQLREALSELVAAAEQAEAIDRETAFEMSFIVRRLIERETGLPALEMTGRELRLALDRTPLPGDASLWQRLGEQSLQLENVKFQPGARGRQSVGEWIRAVQDAADRLEAVRAQEESEDA